MKIKTRKGIAEGMPLSDLQKNTFWVRMVVFSVLLWWITFIILLWYATSHETLAHIIKTIGDSLR